MYNRYGEASVSAAKLCVAEMTAEAAWDRSVRTLFPNSVSSQQKGCPRSAFLGLCAAGFVKGIKPVDNVLIGMNGEYAVKAAKALRENPELARSRRDLWSIAVSDIYKKHNSQMDVVVALWSENLLV